MYNKVSYNMTLSCQFSRYIVNKSKSEYPETIAKYGKKNKQTKNRETGEFSRYVIRLNNSVCHHRPIRDESFTNARYAIRVLYKFLLHLPCQLESWRKTSTQAPTCSLLRQEKKVRIPKPSESEKSGLRFRTKIT